MVHQLAKEFWSKYIVDGVDGIETKEYILSCIIPRPRDLIYFISSAKSIAVSRGHQYIKENDLTAAYDDFIQIGYFKSILVENGVTINQMQDFLYNVMGESSILSRETNRRTNEYLSLQLIPMKVKKLISWPFSFKLPIIYWTGNKDRKSLLTTLISETNEKYDSVATGLNMDS